MAREYKSIRQDMLTRTAELSGQLLDVIHGFRDLREQRLALPADHKDFEETDFQDGSGNPLSTIGHMDATIAAGALDIGGDALLTWLNGNGIGYLHEARRTTAG